VYGTEFRAIGIDFKLFEHSVRKGHVAKRWQAKRGQAWFVYVDLLLDKASTHVKLSCERTCYSIYLRICFCDQQALSMLLSV
jgi:hypothetical protein